MDFNTALKAQIRELKAANAKLAEIAKGTWVDRQRTIAAVILKNAREIRLLEKNTIGIHNAGYRLYGEH